MATPLPPEVLPPDYEALGSIGGLLTPREDYIPNLQSVYGDIVQNAADYQYFTAPLSNQGRTTASYGTGNNLVVAPDTPVRLVNNATGEVVYSGVGYEGAQGAIDAANALSASAGKKANWDIQVAGPTMQGFQSVSTDRPDVSGLGIVADVALPVAGSLLAGPLGLGALGLGTAGTAAAGAALGSGLSSAAQGRSIEDALLRAAIAGGGSYLGSQLFAPGAAPTGATVGENLPSWGVLAEPYARAAEAALAGSISGSAPAAVGDIVVTALGRIPTTVGGAFGGLATSLLPSVFDAAQLNDMATMDQMGAEQPSDYVVTAQLPTTPVVTPPAILPPGTPPFNPAEDINLTAKTTTKTTPTGAELAALGAIGLGVPAILSTTGGAGTGATTTTGTGGGTGTGAGTGAGTAAVGKGVLGTGLTATQLATLGTLGLGGLSSLLGGSGGAGTTTTTPYVSPFGALGGGMGMGAGMDYRATPNILDYERYGFGPEAAFFRPEYSRLVSTGASMGSPAAAPAQQQQYTPLI